MEEIQDQILTVLLASLFLLLFFVGFLIFTILYFRRFNQLQLEKNELKLVFEKTIKKVELEIKEQTMQHIARELHDNLGQVASLIKINLYTLKLEDTLQTREKIESTQELARQMIVDIRALSTSLNGDRVTQLGLAKSLESEVEKLNKTGLIVATLHQPDYRLILDANTTLILFRIGQEILNNTLKHSCAKHVTISLNVSEKLFTLAISDDGIGFNLEEKISSGGSGLLNLQNRAKLIHAEFSIQSSPNGTSISIQLPLVNNVIAAPTTTH